MNMLMLIAAVTVFDFGPNGAGGYPEIEVTGVTAPAKVRVVYATHPDGLTDKGDFWHETRATYMGPDLWLPILPASTDRYDVFSVTSNGVYRSPLVQGLVRYAKWSLDAGKADVRQIRLVNRAVHSVETVLGSFACSDARLDAVWKASVRTCQLAAIPGRTTPLEVCGPRSSATLGPSYPYLSDGAKRDRLVWSGDLWWAQRNMYAAFAFDSPYMPGSIRMLGENQLPNGYVQACPYPESHAVAKADDYGPFASDEFACWFVPVVCDHYLYTGDEKTTREAYPRVVKLMDYLGAHQQAGGKLFEPRRETCKGAAGLVFGSRSLHHSAYMNILLWKTYRDAAALADVFGSKTEAGEWRTAAEILAGEIRRAFWDEKKGYFRQSLEEDAFAKEGNPLALAAHFVTEAEAERIVPALRRHSHGKFQAMAARGAFEYGYADRAMALIAEHNWYKVVEPEWKGLRLTSECMGLIRKGWGDEAHPDTAIAGLFTNYILGVEPVEPGYAAFRVRPKVPAGITWANGVVPTPKGFIKVAWTMKDGFPDVTVRAPVGCRQVE